jgi:hypothetical protein
MASESSYLPHPPLLTAADFTAAYRQLFMLLAERPLDVPRLQALWTAMDVYAVRVPYPTWPLVLVDADRRLRLRRVSLMSRAIGTKAHFFCSSPLL